MQNSSSSVKEIAQRILESGQADRLLGWERGEYGYDHAPAVFSSVEELKGCVYDLFCGSNLSSMLLQERSKPGRTAVLLKPCDRDSFKLLVKEHRVDPETVHVIEIACTGMVDIDRIKRMGIKGIQRIIDCGDELQAVTLYGEKRCSKQDVLLEKCSTCREISTADPFAPVEAIEKLTSRERYEFWRGELSKCIRCNACRNICPACTCEQCIFDNPRSKTAAKASADPFEDQQYHLIRAFHTAGRCTDCGECSRVCPQGIPLYLLNRKVMKDIKELYGDLQDGEEQEGRSPLTSFAYDDADPDIIRTRGGDQ